jgi:hypothetical protein
VQRGQDAERAFHFAMWDWDTDLHDDSFVNEIGFAMRDGSGAKARHDRHNLGVFSMANGELLKRTGDYIEQVE